MGVRAEILVVRSRGDQMSWATSGVIHLVCPSAVKQPGYEAAQPQDLALAQASPGPPPVEVEWPVRSTLILIDGSI